MSEMCGLMNSRLHKDTMHMNPMSNILLIVRVVKRLNLISHFNPNQYFYDVLAIVDLYPFVLFLMIHKSTKVQLYLLPMGQPLYLQNNNKILHKEGSFSSHYLTLSFYEIYYILWKCFVIFDCFHAV